MLDGSSPSGDALDGSSPPGDVLDKSSEFRMCWIKKKTSVVLEREIIKLFVLDNSSNVHLCWIEVQRFVCAGYLDSSCNTSA